MKLDTVEQLDNELAKKLIGKHIHFTWHNRKDNTVETMPGKVLNYKEGKIKIDTMDIVIDDNITTKEKNKMVKIFDINDITNVLEFTEYNNNFYSLLDKFDKNNFRNNKFKINSVFGGSIITNILDYDSLFITIILDGDKYDYPLYFVKSICLAKSKRAPKQYGDFGEQLVTNILVQYLYKEVAIVDHVGADLILSHNKKKYAISVKSRIMPESESNSYLFEREHLENLKSFSNDFNMIPALSFVVTDSEEIRVYIMTLETLESIAKSDSGLSNVRKNGLSFNYKFHDNEIKSNNKIFYIKFKQTEMADKFDI